jgi:hypothetical protein
VKFMVVCGLWRGFVSLFVCREEGFGCLRLCFCFVCLFDLCRGGVGASEILFVCSFVYFFVRRVRM